MTLAHQRGIALIVALVILVPLTLIAVVVMQSGSMGLKMAGASARYQQAEHRGEGALLSALNSAGLSSEIVSLIPGVAKTIGPASPTTGLTLKVEGGCKRKFAASSQNVIPACRYAEASTSSTYGKLNSQITYTAGVEQPLLSAAN